MKTEAAEGDPHRPIHLCPERLIKLLLLLLTAATAVTAATAPAGKSDGSPTSRKLAAAVAVAAAVVVEGPWERCCCRKGGQYLGRVEVLLLLT